MAENTNPKPESDKIEVIKYPEDLSPNRFISLEFFDPANIQNISNLLEAMKKAGISLFSTADGKNKSNVAEVAKAFSNVGDKTSKVIKTAANNILSGERSAFKEKVLKGILYLPLPNSLNDTSQNRYQESSGAISSLVTKINSSSVSNSFNEISNSVGAKNIIFNSDLNQVYKGSNLRTLSLSWMLIPQNVKERNNVIRMIKMIKKYSSPDASISRLFLMQPSLVNVVLSNPTLNDIQRYHNMAINSVSIEFGSGGNMEMFYDGMIKEITLSISLVELKINTKQDWSDDKKSQLEKSKYEKESYDTQKKIRELGY